MLPTKNLFKILQLNSSAVLKLFLLQTSFPRRNLISVIFLYPKHFLKEKLHQTSEFTWFKLINIVVSENSMLRHT